MMKSYNKRWSDKAAIGSYNHLAYNKLVVSRDCNFASLVRVIAITNLFLIQHEFVQYLLPWPYHTLSKDYSNMVTHNDFSLFTNHFWHPALLFGHYSLLHFPSFMKSVM